MGLVPRHPGGGGWPYRGLCSGPSEERPVADEPTPQTSLLQWPSPGSHLPAKAAASQAPGPCSPGWDWELFHIRNDRVKVYTRKLSSQEFHFQEISPLTYEIATAVFTCN